MYLPYLMCGYAATVILMLAGCYAFSRTSPGLRGLRLLVWALVCGLIGVLLLATRPFAEFAPERDIGRIAPRPIVMVNGIDDPQMPRRAVESLYDAARQPKTLHHPISLADTTGRIRLRTTFVDKQIRDSNG